MPGPAFRGNLVAGGDVDHVDGEIGQFRREGRGQIVAAGFDQNQVEIGKFRPHVGDRGEIHRRIFADRGVRTTSGFDADDAIRRQRPRTNQELRVPFRVDVVGDRGDLVALAQLLAQQIHQRGLARIQPVHQCRREAGRCSSSSELPDQSPRPSMPKPADNASQHGPRMTPPLSGFAQGTRAPRASSEATRTVATRTGVTRLCCFAHRISFRNKPAPRSGIRKLDRVREIERCAVRPIRRPGRTDPSARHPSSPWRARPWRA